MFGSYAQHIVSFCFSNVHSLAWLSWLRFMFYLVPCPARCLKYQNSIRHIFPVWITLNRNLAVGTCSTIARLGFILASYIVMLVSNMCLWTTLGSWISMVKITMIHWQSPENEGWIEKNGLTTFLPWICRWLNFKSFASKCILNV